MARIGELLRRGPSEQEQQRAETKDVFGEISDLAPHQKVSYVSDSLSTALLLIPDENIRMIARLLNLREEHPLLVNTVSPEEPLSSVIIHNNGTGLDTLLVDYHRKTYAVKRIKTGNAPFATGDQTLLLQTLRVIRADLLGRREDFRSFLAVKREEFEEKLYPQETTAIAYILKTINDTFERQYSVFGSIEDKEENAGNGEDGQRSTRIVRLFITRGLDIETARGIAGNMPPNLKKVYSMDLTQSKNEIDGFKVDPRKLILHDPGFEIHIENFWPARNRNRYTLYVQNDDIISEGLFEAFMSGQEQGFRPLTSSKEPVLLDKRSKDDTYFFKRDFWDVQRSNKNTEVA